jgi:hypothetical protein
MIVDLLTVLTASLSGIAAFLVAGYFHKADQRRTLAILIESHCPHCRKIYGVDLLANISQIAYEWTPLPGNTTADSSLPRSTFLATCPSCAIQTEYRENAQVFVPPTSGLLDFTRQIQSLSLANILPAESAPASMPAPQKA